jgi:microcystin-dependent protein
MGAADLAYALANAPEDTPIDTANMFAMNIFKGEKGDKGDKGDKGTDGVDGTRLPVGTINPFAGNTVPDGWLKCDGSAISRTTYADLFAVIGTTYGTGDGSTTFTLPNFINRTFWGGSSSGAVKNAGLPNITGKLAVGNTQAPSISPIGQGAFKDHGVSGGTQGASWTAAGTYYDFNASLSNSIYGASSTVQPPAIQTLICIKY